jgi:hypothetical protein
MQDFSDLGITRAEYYSSEWHKIMHDFYKNMDEVAPPRRRTLHAYQEEDTEHLMIERG